MLVDSTNFVGPALWQGLMLCAMPLAFVGMCWGEGRYFWWSVGGYVALGVALMAAILSA